MDLLSKKETLQFLRDVLEIPIKELPQLSHPSIENVPFLETILQAYLERQPFQSISLMSDEVVNRHRPSWDEIKRNMFLRRGGLCYWHNTFMYVLLDSLGYDVIMSHSTVLGFDVDNHLVVLVRDLVNSGDLYLVDVGMGYYMPRPISIDFRDESPVFTDSIMTYKFKRESETKIILLKASVQDTQASTSNELQKSRREHQNVPTSLADSPKSVSNTREGNHVPEGTKNLLTEISQKTKEDIKWDVLYYFNPQENFKNLDEFFPCFDICFTDVTKLPFHTSPRAIHWSNGKMVGIVNGKLLQETTGGQITKAPIINYVPNVNTQANLEDVHKELKPLILAYSQHFPQFPTDLVLAALQNWKPSPQEELSNIAC